MGPSSSLDELLVQPAAASWGSRLGVLWLRMLEGALLRRRGLVLVMGEAKDGSAWEFSTCRRTCSMEPCGSPSAAAPAHLLLILTGLLF